MRGDVDDRWDHNMRDDADGDSDAGSDGGGGVVDGDGDRGGAGGGFFLWYSISACGFRHGVAE